MSHTIKIVSGYNGRTHESIVTRAEDLLGIEVDGEVVYYDKTKAPAYGVTIEDGPNPHPVLPPRRKHLVRTVPH